MPSSSACSCCCCDGTGGRRSGVNTSCDERRSMAACAARAASFWSGGCSGAGVGTRGGAVPDAPLDPKESAAGIVALIDRLKPEDTGKFLSWQGETMPW